MKVFVVLGAGRSATSLIAKGLHEAGVHMGDRLLGKSPSQPHGHYEDKDLIELNERLLTLLGASWHEPPDLDDVRSLAGTPAEAAIADYIQMRCKGHDLWGMKDPRTVLLWPLWEPVLRSAADDLHVIHVWRDLERVAASLAARDGFSHEEARCISEAYQDRMRDYVKEVADAR